MIDMSSLNFQYPQQWQTASDVLSMFAQGMPTQIPGMWNQMGQGLEQMWGQQGMPTDMSKWWQSQQQAIQPDITRRIQEATEQAGLGGLRYSTPLGQQIGRIAGEETARIMPEYWRMGMGAQEAARGRMMQTLPMMMQLGAGQAGLAESAKDRAMGATGQLAGLGQQYANLPMQVAGMFSGLGNQMQQEQMQAFMPYLQEFMRTMPESNPYLQMGMGFPYGQFGMQPQQYQPSFLTQLLGAGSSILPFLLGGPAGAAGAGIPWLTSMFGGSATGTNPF